MLDAGANVRAFGPTKICGMSLRNDDILQLALERGHREIVGMLIAQYIVQEHELEFIFLMLVWHNDKYLDQIVMLGCDFSWYLGHTFCS